MPADSRAEETCNRPLVMLDEPGQMPQSADDVGVPITVLTTDANLCDAIRAAAPQRHPVLIAADPDEAAKYAETGRSSILVIDIVSAQSAIRRIAERFRTHQPALVIIAVGSRGDEHALMDLLSAGIVDLLMLKPVTPMRAQVVITSAAQQHQVLKTSSDNDPHRKKSQSAGHCEPSGTAPDEQSETAAVLADSQREPANEPAEPKLQRRLLQADVPKNASTHAAGIARKPITLPRPSWMAVVAALAVVAGVVWWVMFRQLPDIDPAEVIATNLAAAQLALKDGHSVAPPGRSAADYYGTVLALDPTNAEAKKAIDRIADQLVHDAGTSIAEGRIAAASVALEGVRHVRPDDRRLRSLEAQLRAEQEKLALMFRARQATAGNSPPLSNKVHTGLRPESQSVAVEQKLLDARARVLSQANLAIERRELDAASALIEEARNLGASGDELDTLDQAFLAARQSREKENLLQLILQRTAENRLLEPVQDSAKYYLEQLAQTDSQFAGLDQGISALGGRLVANAQLASAENNFDLAESLLSQAREIGFTGTRIETVEARIRTARDALAAAIVAQAADRALVQLVKPVYPRVALLRGIEGWVDLSLSVTASGDVVDPQIEESSQGHVFERAALAAVRKWKYEPRAGSDPDDTQRLKVRVSFRLEDQGLR